MVGRKIGLGVQLDAIITVGARLRKPSRPGRQCHEDGWFRLRRHIGIKDKSGAGEEIRYRPQPMASQGTGPRSEAHRWRGINGMRDLEQKRRSVRQWCQGSKLLYHGTQSKILLNPEVSLSEERPFGTMTRCTGRCTGRWAFGVCPTVTCTEAGWAGGIFKAAWPAQLVLEI